MVFRAGGDPLRVLTALPKYGEVVRVGVGKWQAFVVCEPELLWHVLSDHRTYDKGGVLKERVSTLIGNGLLTCGHAEHRRQRRMVQPAFSRTITAGYVSKMPDAITAIISDWRAGHVIDVLDFTHVVSARVTCDALFATGRSGDGFEQMASDLDIFMTRMYKTLLVPSAVCSFIPGNRRYQAAAARLRGIAGDIVDAAGGEGDHGAILSRLNAVRDEDGRGMSRTELIDQVTTLMGAAVDTTAAALAWALYLLAEHPDAADRVFDEVEAVLSGQTPTADDVPKLEFTQRVVNEALRLYPPAWMLTRVTTTATELAEQRIPAGTTVVCSPYLVHHRADLYRDPDRFDPERENGDLPHGAFLPFGAGARKCIGDRFAVAELTLVLAMVTRQWWFEPIPGARIRPAARMVLVPESLRLRLVAR